MNYPLCMQTLNSSAANAHTEVQYEVIHHCPHFLVLPGADMALLA